MGLCDSDLYDSLIMHLFVSKVNTHPHAFSSFFPMVLAGIGRFKNKPVMGIENCGFLLREREGKIRNSPAFSILPEQ